jgi:hypothetical protein
MANNSARLFGFPGTRKAAFKGLPSLATIPVELNSGTLTPYRTPCLQCKKKKLQYATNCQLCTSGELKNRSFTLYNQLCREKYEKVTEILGKPFNLSRQNYE